MRTTFACNQYRLTPLWPLSSRKWIRKKIYTLILTYPNISLLRTARDLQGTYPNYLLRLGLRVKWITQEEMYKQKYPMVSRSVLGHGVFGHSVFRHNVSSGNFTKIWTFSWEIKNTG